VLVNYREGFFKQPWIVSIEPDDERRLRAILKVMPTASQLWKRLVDFYFRHGRHDEALATGNEYLKLYPNDYDFAMAVAGALFNINKHPRAVPLLEPFLAKRPTLELHQMLGFAMFAAGRKVEGEALMRKATAMQPDDWNSYYFLGYAHFYTGGQAGALPWFERLLEIAPNFPEIQERVRAIRSAKAARKSS